jgi:hypothetical protein
MNAAVISWLVVGALVVLCALALLIREFPAIRRELRLMRM